MKHKTLIALAGCGTLIASSSADAAFVGLQLVDVSQWMSTVGPTNFRNSYNAAGGPATHQIYRVFATFDDTAIGDPNNRVNVIHGLPNAPWSLTLNSGAVHNYTTYTSSGGDGHFNYAPASSSSVYAQQGWETWTTIGIQFGGPNYVLYTPGAHASGQLNNLQPNFSADNAAMLILPEDVQGNAIALNNTSIAGQGGSGFGVLLMQITVTSGSIFSGQFNLNIGAAGSSHDVLGLTFNNIPAPGALALFGVAGLVRSRRRRFD